MVPEVFRELNIDKQAMLDTGKNLPGETSVVPAAEVGDALTRERRVTANGPEAQPHTETIDR